MLGDFFCGYHNVTSGIIARERKNSDVMAPSGSLECLFFNVPSMFPSSTWWPNSGRIFYGPHALKKKFCHQAESSNFREVGRGQGGCNLTHQAGQRMNSKHEFGTSVSTRTNFLFFTTAFQTGRCSLRRDEKDAGAWDGINFNFDPVRFTSITSASASRSQP